MAPFTGLLLRVELSVFPYQGQCCVLETYTVSEIPRKEVSTYTVGQQRESLTDRPLLLYKRCQSVMKINNHVYPVYGVENTVSPRLWPPSLEAVPI